MVLMCSKKRVRARLAILALVQSCSKQSQTVWSAKASRFMAANIMARFCLPWPKLGSVAICVSGLIGYKRRYGETAASGPGAARPVLQGAAIHRRGDPLGGSLVPHVPNQLPRPRADAR